MQSLNCATLLVLLFTTGSTTLGAEATRPGPEQLDNAATVASPSPDRALLGVLLSAEARGEGRRGATVLQLIPGGVAARAGVQKGDIIASVNGTPIQDALDVLEIISRVELGTIAVVEVLRGSERLSLTAQF